MGLRGALMESVVYRCIGIVHTTLCHAGLQSCTYTVEKLGHCLHTQTNSEYLALHCTHKPREMVQRPTSAWGRIMDYIVF
jgi:hypothetical protein